MTLWILLAVLVVVAAFAVVLYNRLVRRRQMADEGWSGIDVQLKRRADLVPNLVTTVAGYASHERGVLEEVTALRGQISKLRDDDVAGRSRLEGELGAGLRKLFALAEAYPDLKANRNFLELQSALATTEDEIQMARRYYNGAVRNLNILVQSFPNNLVAGAFGFGEREYFEIDDADRAVPAVSFQGGGT